DRFDSSFYPKILPLFIGETLWHYFTDETFYHVKSDNIGRRETKHQFLKDWMGRKVKDAFIDKLRPKHVVFMDDPVEVFYVDRNSIFGTPLCYSFKFGAVYIINMIDIITFQTLLLVKLSIAEFDKITTWRIVFIPIYLSIIITYTFSWINYSCFNKETTFGKSIQNKLSKSKGYSNFSNYDITSSTSPYMILEED
ncbi:2 TM domain-containing transmembrane protein, partial [Acrasis kona]